MGIKGDIIWILKQGVIGFVSGFLIIFLLVAINSLIIAFVTWDTSVFEMIFEMLRMYFVFGVMCMVGYPILKRFIEGIDSNE